MDFTDSSLCYALHMDAEDELNDFRKEFIIPEKDTVYLDGNSLGRMPRKVIDKLRHVAEYQWADRLIRSWNEGWIDTSVRLGDKIARLIGAEPGEVIVTDATSINLFKLVAAALKDKPGRNRIVSDDLNFPSDLYILNGINDLFGKNYEICLVHSVDGIHTDPDDIDRATDEDTALLTLTHTCFKSAFVHDMMIITERAHNKGCYVLWDLSHSVGAVPVDLNGCSADLAVGCTYKYLNGGPGSPAFLFVRRDLQKQLIQPVWGWLGSGDPFSFSLEYDPANDITRYQVGTPPMLSMLAMEPGLDLHLSAGMDRLRKKSIMQTEYLIYLFDQWLVPGGFSLGSPRDPEKRGSHISIRHQDAYRINRAMIETEPPGLKIIPDFRPPDNIRLGIAPIYTSFEDIYRAVRRIKEIVEKKIYENYSNIGGKVN